LRACCRALVTLRASLCGPLVQRAEAADLVKQPDSLRAEAL
jgi:hypothetical protein